MQIINKDGGLILKDSFEGGATWAFEVGSQPMACPIIVEDLNQPRQMLVEVVRNIYLCFHLIRLAFLFSYDSFIDQVFVFLILFFAVTDAL